MASWPDLVALEALVGVADHGSIAAAAREAGMAQPNVSVSIARLERRVGVRLLSRSTTGARPTPAGSMVIDWARPVLASARTFADHLSTLAPGPEVLAVAASHTVAENYLPAWVARLRREHSEVRVDIEVCNSTEVLDRVRAGRCELGFIEGPKPPSDIRHRVVGTDKLVLVVTPGDPLAGRVVTLAQLADIGLVTREAGSGMRRALERVLHTQGLVAAEPTQVASSNAAVRVAVLSGAGPAVISRRAVASALAAGELVEVDLEVEVTRRLRAVWSGPARPPASVQHLVGIAIASAPDRS